MKAMLIADSDSLSVFLTDFLRNYGFDMIRYRSPVKALDNIEEIDPDAMIISAEDYPRHWKTLVQYVRQSRKTGDVLVILFAGQNFSGDDAAKATALSVQAVLKRESPPEEKTAAMHKILARYAETDSACPADAETLKKSVFVVFPNPFSGTLITGAVFFLTEKLLKFTPDAPAAAADISAGERIGECRLKLNGKTVSLPFLVKQNTKNMTLVPDGEAAAKSFAAAVTQYLSDLPQEASLP